MRLLLDTHAFLWFVDDDPRLGPIGRHAIIDGGNEVYLSLASAWEMAIKNARGRLPLRQNLKAFVEEETARNTIRLLAITLEHLERTLVLPAHHRDPFDRLLIAQAQVEGMRLVSCDAEIARYEVERLW